MTNPNIDHNRRILYSHNPRTGGTTIKKFLNLNFNDSTSHIIAKNYKYPIWMSYFTIGSIRHPIDRLISNYYYHIPDGRNIYEGVHSVQLNRLKDLTLETYFENFIKKENPAGGYAQFLYIFHPINNLSVDCLIRYESFLKDLETLNDRLNLNNSSIPHLHSSPTSKRNRDITYDKELHESIVSYYKMDFKVFDYSTNYQLARRRYID